MYNTKVNNFVTICNGTQTKIITFYIGEDKFVLAPIY